MSVPETFIRTPSAPGLLQDRPVPTPQGPLQVPGGLFPPPPIWVDQNDFLLLQCRNALAAAQLQVAARLLEPDGRIITPAFTLSPTSDRTLNTATQGLYTGYLLGATVVAIGATVPTRGQTYCVLKLQRMPTASALNHFLLGADYVSGSLGLQWPYGRTIGAIEGPGVLRSIAGTAPAAGADFTQTVPTGARWRLRSVRASITTSAAVATRRPRLLIDDGANVFMDIDSGNNVVASTTTPYSWDAGHSYIQSFSDAESFVPPDVSLLAGWRIRSVTGSIQAGDQWTAPRLLVEEWLED